MSTLIRRASGPDGATLAALASEHADYERSSVRPDARLLAAALDAGSQRLWVWLAEAAEHPVGYAAVTEDFSIWRAQVFLHLDCLFVRSAHRGRGIVTLEWQTPSWNEGAIRFYERLGGKHALKARFSLDL